MTKPHACEDNDNTPTDAMGTLAPKPTMTVVASNPKPPSLPNWARLPINRCNLPAVILGSLTFQQNPTDLYLDGVMEIHRRLFCHLNTINDLKQRARYFMDYMVVYFRLEALEAVGLTPTASKQVHLRRRADYIRMLRGWSFNPDYREGAVLKAWVESRFGLLANYHGGSLRNRDGENYLRYLEARSQGLYNTNALEAQLDLLYTYCQYELRRQYPGILHFSLYRGFNYWGDDQVLAQLDNGNRIVLLNNLSSFTLSWERADEFGDQMLKTRIPRSKIFFYSNLLPGLLKGEDEYMVIGGVCEVQRL